MNCDVGKATEGLENELWRRWSDGKIGEWAYLILQPVFRFSYVTGSSLNVTWRAAHAHEMCALEQKYALLNPLYSVK